MKKLLVVLFIVAACGFIYESFFSYIFVTEEVRWSSNELLWEVGARCAGPHEDIREVISRIERDNPNAKPGDVLKVEIKVRR